MRNITYYVASSLDGYISGPQNDISGFIQEGPGVVRYQEDLQQFDTVIMGRNTYEFAYQYGLQAGQPAYPNMQHYIFSDHLQFENPHASVQACAMDLDFIRALKAGPGQDIYLCGGGQFAGWLLDHELIDVLKLKLNPLVLGAGVRLFGNSSTNRKLQLVDCETFEDGLQIITYNFPDG